MSSQKFSLSALILVAALGLAACDSSEERAEAHYQSSLELLDAGDVERALVELRNVLALDEGHKEGRTIYARLVHDSGRPREAYRQYLFLAESSPDELEPRVALAEIAANFNDWEEAERHAGRALEIAPEDTGARAVDALVRYRNAVVDEDEPARREAAEAVRVLLAEYKNRSVANEIVIDSLIKDNDFRGALQAMEEALEADPENIDLHGRRVALLNRLGEEEEVQAALEDLVVRFPEDDAFRNTLTEWYVTRGERDKARKFLRARAQAAEAESGEYVFYVLFLRRAYGIEEARAELEEIVASGRDETIFTSLLATLTFDGGDREAGIAALETVLDAAPVSDETRNTKVTLARMLFTVGNQVAGRARIEEVLAEDATNVEALKLKAGWLIEDDRADEAIIALRTALDQEPRDPQIMSLMAQAHLRNGSRGLARDMLALAAEASNNAPDYALNYARFLISDDNLPTAEAILIEALRAAPDTPALLTELGRIYIRMRDWARAQQVEATLRRQGTDMGDAAANSLEVARLQEQGRGRDAIALLQELADSIDGEDGAEVAIVRSYLRSGDFEEAEAYIEEALAANPDRTVMRYLQAALYSSTERNHQAEAIYRALLSEDPQSEVVWRTLYAHHLRLGDRDTAKVVLDEALGNLPEAPNLLWARASEYESDGDIDAAIGIYETLYARDSGAVVVANNLASLLTTYRSDEESLDRAYTIARRLRAATLPAFQDTYGWIAYRRGLYDEALEYLAPAAEGLPQDPLVQYHYGKALAASERFEEAITQFRKAIEIAGPADTRPQFDEARSEIDRLEALIAESPDQ